MTKSEQRIQAIREETERIYQRIAKSQEESDARITKLREEAEARQKQSDERIAELRKETERITRETRDLSKENERRIAELTAQSKEQNKQLGGYGNKFGALTEALAQPSLRRILKERFNAQHEDSYSRRSMEHGDVEIDAWGVARNGETAVYLIEIKSRFRPEHLRQVWRHVEMFRALEPEHRDAPVYPILAVVEIEKEHRELIWESGIYLIDVADGVFELAEPPAEFEPFGHHGAEKSGGGMQRAVSPQLRLVPKAARAGQKG